MLCRASNGELVARQLGWAFSRNSEFGWESKNRSVLGCGPEMLCLATSGELPWRPCCLRAGSGS